MRLQPKAKALVMLLTFAIVAPSAAQAAAQNTSAGDKLGAPTSAVASTSSGQPSAASAAEAVECSDLLKSHFDGIEISDATALPDGSTAKNDSAPFLPAPNQPAHCVVHGEVGRHKGANGMEYGDKFELRMPDKWNGRFMFQGGAGLDGFIFPAIGWTGAPLRLKQTALSRGYAVVSTDAGHKALNANDGSFGADPQAFADYAYQSTPRVTDAVRKIIAAHYGKLPDHSYFVGCSNGGREAMKTAQQFPDYFDGIIAGGPAFDLSGAAMGGAWTVKQMGSIAPKNPDGSLDYADALSDSDLKLLAQSVLDKCDALDGAKDGMVSNPGGCHYDPAVLQCKGDKTDTCLSAAQIAAVKKVFDGAKTSSGKQVYSSWPYDPGIASPGWRMWTLGFKKGQPNDATIFPPMINGVDLKGVPPEINFFSFDFDRDPARVKKFSSDIDAESTNYSGFKKHSGKLIIFAGLADAALSADDLAAYYKRLIAANGGVNKTWEFARLFLIPGMNHCGGGPALDDFDLLTAIEKWVEQGKAPTDVVASGPAFPKLSRPLCSYPQVPFYKGTGSTDDAANFECRNP